MKYSEDLLNKTEELVKPTYDKIKIWGHGWLHILNVVKAARRLAEMENEDTVLCQIAAYCHDLGRLREEEIDSVNFTPGAPSAHAGFSVAPTKVILDELGIDDKDKNLVLEAVRVHSLRVFEGNNKIALILQDADRCDGFGMIGVLRMAVFNCRIDIPEPINEHEAENLLLEVKKILKDNPEKRNKMISALVFVFDWVDELANTESFKKYIQEGYRFNKDFLDEVKNYA